jgi:[acyl-carrier-protein] S-malonyltransferase
MTIAFTFPGQGSQAVGMGKELADAFPAARDVFAEVDEALGEKLSTIMWDGPEDKLTLTANAQPALMAVSIAVVRVLASHGYELAEKASHVAGHSLGEYSAHCAAGTFTLADTAQLLRIRGNAMQGAVAVGEGAMAAIIGLEHPDVSFVCEAAAGETGGFARSPMTMAAASWLYRAARRRLSARRRSRPRRVRNARSCCRCRRRSIAR